MTDSADDAAADDAQSATAASTTSTEDPGTEGDESPAAVATNAGIDDTVLGVSRELEPLVRLQWSIRSAIGSIVIGAIAAGVALVGSETGALTGDVGTAASIGVAVVTLLVIVGVVRAVLLYRSWTYVVRGDSLFLSRGVLTHVRTVVPYVRVQHIETTRSPLERLLGLSTLVVYTAGSRGADVTIPGLAPARASTLQERLERLAIESEEGDAV